MNEENTTIMPPEKQIVQDDRDARAEELESAFSYDGYQVVRKELFAHECGKGCYSCSWESDLYLCFAEERSEVYCDYSVHR